MIKLIISIFVFLTLFIFNTAFVFAGILDVSFNAEPSATGDIALYWHAEDPEQGDVVLKYGIDKKYDQRYNFNISIVIINSLFNAEQRTAPIYLQALNSLYVY